MSECRTLPMSDLAGKLQPRLDPEAPPSQLVEVVARALRAMRDRDRAAQKSVPSDDAGGRPAA